MELTERQSRLFEWVKIQHGSQIRKYTQQPYWTHLLSVAEIVHRSVKDHGLLIEIALCHDLVEDTEACGLEFLLKLNEFGYSQQEALFIHKSVSELTNRFTKKDFPDKPRRIRKDLERQRLILIDRDCQTVKYADIIDNVSTIMDFDPSFGDEYVSEKRELLEGMDQGDPVLYALCQQVVDAAFQRTIYA